MTSDAVDASQVDFNSAPCGLIVTDTEDVVVRVNATFLEWSGYRSDEVLGREFHSFLDVGNQAFYGTRFQDELWARKEVREISLRLQRSDGATMPILVNARMVADGSRYEGARLAVFDASAREEFAREMLAAKRAAETSEANVRVLQDAATRFLAADNEAELAAQIADIARQAFAAVDVAVVAYEPDGTSFRVLHGSHLRPLLDEVRATRAPGSIALGPTDLLLISDLDDAFSRSDQLGQAFRIARAAAFSADPIANGDKVLGALGCLYGHPRVFDQTDIDIHRALSRQAGLAFERVRLQETLRRLATEDQLTGVRNRTSIDNEVALAFDASLSGGEALSVIFLDLDGFKQINDELGHRAGDLVLQTVASRLEKAVRAHDAVGRFGGDEFVIVCAEADESAIGRVADRISRAVGERMPELPEGFGISASLGVAVFDPATSAETSPEALIRIADAAMYQSKRSGNGNVTIVRA